MGVTLAIARREFASFFRVPLGWLALALFALVSSWLFLRGVLIPGQPATMRPVFSTMGWLLLPMAPAVSMRLLSEELRSGTIEPLMSSPASDYAVIFGKFLGAMAFLALLVSPTLAHAAILWLSASPAPDPGPLLAGYLSVALLAGLFLSAGLLVSTMTANQTLAFLGAMAAILAMMVGPELIAAAIDPAAEGAAGAARTFVLGLRIGTRLEDFAKGVLDTGHIVAFAAWTALFLVASAVSLESRRWRSVRSFRRVVKFGGVSVFLLAAALLSAVLATTLADRFGRRVDVTSTGEHKLAARTKAILAEAADKGSKVEIIVAADWLAMDRRVREDLRDVMGRFAEGNGAVTARTIDFASSAGRAGYAALLKDLSERQRGAMKAARGAVEGALARTPALRNDLAAMIVPGVDQTLASAPGLDGLGEALRRVREAAAAASATARTLGAAEERAGTLLSRAIEGVPVPATDEAAAALRQALETCARRLLTLEAEIKTLAGAQPRAAGTLRGLGDGVRARRELADTIGDSIRDLPPLDALVVASAVGESAAMIVRRTGSTEGGGAGDAGGVGGDAVGGVGVRAQPLSRIIRDGRDSSADLKRRAESEIADALAALGDAAPPIVVFLSCDPAIASGYRVSEEAAQRVKQAGGEVVSWDLLLSADPPPLTKLNPTGARPVVYVVRMPDQTQTAYGQTPSGIDRARQVAEVAKGLSESGAGVLLCVSPAVVPTAKEADASDRALRPMGLSAAADRVILAEVRSAGAAGVDLNIGARPVVRVGTPEPLADAVGGAPVVLPWATGIVTGGAARPVFETTGESPLWAESRWIELRRSITEGRPLGATPKFDLGEDQRPGPWTTVAVAQSGARRLVAVGSAEWLDDGLLQRKVTVDGRVTPVAAGNLELFDAAVSWLAGRDRTVPAGATSGSVAVVGRLSERGRSGLAWALLGGLPLGVLALGVAYRAARG